MIRADTFAKLRTPRKWMLREPNVQVSDTTGAD